MTPPRPEPAARPAPGTLVRATRDDEVRTGRLRRRQQILAELGARSFVAEGFLDLLAEALDDIVDSLGVSHAALFERVPGSTLLVMRAGVGWRPGAVGQMLEYDGGDAFLGPIFTSHTSVHVSGASPAQMTPLFAEHGIVSGLAVMLPGPHGPVGTLCALARDARQFDDDDEHFLRALANIFSWAIQRKGTEEGLLQSQLRLQGVQKMEAIGRLAGGIAHDFNNLVQAIGGYTEVLLKYLPDDDGLRKPAVEIKRAGDRAAALTRQLLAFSRQQVLQPRVLDLNGVVANVEQLLRRLIGEDIEAPRSKPSHGWGAVKCRRGAAQSRCPMNLAVNARDASDGGTLTIETRNVVLTHRISATAFAVSPARTSCSPWRRGHRQPDAAQARAFDPSSRPRPPGHRTGLTLRQSARHREAEPRPSGSTAGEPRFARIYTPASEEPLDRSLSAPGGVAAPPRVRRRCSSSRTKRGVRELMCEWMSKPRLHGRGGRQQRPALAADARRAHRPAGRRCRHAPDGGSASHRACSSAPGPARHLHVGLCRRGHRRSQMLAIGAGFLKKPFCPRQPAAQGAGAARRETTPGTDRPGPRPARGRSTVLHARATIRRGTGGRRRTAPVRGRRPRRSTSPRSRGR